LRGAVTQQRQDLDGGRGELGDEPVGEAGGHPAGPGPSASTAAV
jgi:hypothetical protein